MLGENTVIGYEGKYNILFKTMVTVMLCASSINSISLAEAISYNPPRSALAVYTKLPDSKFRKEFALTESILATKGIKDDIKEPALTICGLFGADVLGDLHLERVFNARLPQETASSGKHLPLRGAGRVSDRLRKLMRYLQSLSQNERIVVGQIAEGALRSTNFEKRRYDDYEYMYALRDIARNLQIEAVRYLGENTSEDIALRRDYRGAAYIFEYVSFVYENMIYEARESLEKRTPDLFLISISIYPTERP